MALLAPVILGCVDWLRGFVILDGYPWFFVGHPIIMPGTPVAVAQIADIGGVAIVCALMYTSAGAVVDMWIGWERSRAGVPLPRRRLALVCASTAVLWIGSYAYGSWRIAQTPEHIEAGPAILAVQTNLPVNNTVPWLREEQERDMEAFVVQTLDLAAEVGKAHQRIDLFVWPETILPGFGLEPESVSTLVSGGWWPGDRFSSLPALLAGRIGSPMLVGSPSYIGLAPKGNQWSWREHFNSAYLVSADGSYQRYDKCFLTPFGETMPYISKWPWLERQLLSVSAVGMTFDLDSCETPVALKLDWRDGSGAPRSSSIATPICFEDTVGPVVRRLVNLPGNDGKCEVLVNLSNDGWFGSFDAGREHHALMARWRCIENRVPLVRVANTGISGAFDSTGAKVGGASLSARTAGGFLATPMIDDRRTIYGMWGDVLSPLMFLSSLFLVSMNPIAVGSRRRALVAIALCTAAIVWLALSTGCASGKPGPSNALETPENDSWGSRAPKPDPNNRQLQRAAAVPPKVEAPAVAAAPAPEPPPTVEPSSGLITPDGSLPSVDAVATGAAIVAAADSTPTGAVAQAPAQRPDPDLAKTDPERLAIEILSNASSSTEAIYRVHGLEGLEYRPAVLEPVACRLLGDENRGVRFAAAVLVGKKRLHECAQMLEPLTLDSSPSVRAAALYALVCLGRTVDLNPLAQLAMSGDAETRSNTLYVLGELRNPTAIPLVESVVGRRLIDADAIRTRIVDLQAAESMAKMGDYRQYDPIRAALFAPPEQGEIVALACQMIGETDDRGARGHLIGVFNGKGPLERPIEIRLIAAAALARIGEPNLEPIFQLCALACRDERSLIRAQAAATLGWAGGNRALGALALLLNDPSPEVRLAAAAGYLRASR